MPSKKEAEDVMVNKTGVLLKSFSGSHAVGGGYL